MYKLIYVILFLLYPLFGHATNYADTDTILPAKNDSIQSDTVNIVIAPTEVNDSNATVADEPKTEKIVPAQYTIQICTMSAPLSDSFFKGQYGIKYIKVGELYRYIFSMYPSIEEAQKDLPMVRKIYPDAFIREYNEDKLGKAFDLNTDHIK